jgi:Ca2+-binding EF-hand superfamily protein
MSFTPSQATEYETFLRVAAERDIATFEAHDRNHDGRLTIEEIRGNVDFEARFDDFDINRDGVITRDELMRYVRIRYQFALATK